MWGTFLKPQNEVQVVNADASALCEANSEQPTCQA